ncbi:phage integrase family protein [Nostoc sp. NIES-2111]|nr:phage integrase family protein [Nostoc sp. NIES-2111]
MATKKDNSNAATHQRKQNSCKATKENNSVGIENKQGKLRLRLPRAVAQDSSRYISTGFTDTPDNRKKALVVAWAIEEDIRTGQLDPTLENYKQQFRPKIAVVKKVNLLELWVSYCEYKRPQLAETTYTNDYKRKFGNHIRELPTKDPREAVAIRDYFVQNLSAYTARIMLTHTSACCNWAVDSGLLDKNPFVGMAGKIRQPKSNASIDPFTTAERDAIIQAFRQHKPHYYPFVNFLFLTGCRTGEAIGLQWQHINPDCTQITFAESYDSRLNIRKCTKTGVVRKFPCNQKLRELLVSIRPANLSPESLVFTSPTGLPINNSKFTSRIWRGCRHGKHVNKGVVTVLVDEGKVQRYRCPYNTRHTFISHCVEAGVPIPQIARWVGNSPEVIMRHYVGVVSSLEVPVI